jgi:Ni/Fe-hydrogenase subunit HybB-like protein
MVDMSLSAAERFFSLLALVALAGSLMIVVLRFVPSARPTLVALAPFQRWAAFAVTATSMAGSLYFSEVQNFIPCRLCWYQRIAMFSLVVVLLVGALRRDSAVRWYAVPLAAIGLLIATYHYIIEWFPQLETGSCDAFAPCSTPYFREFGFVTLSFMAGCGFIAVLTLLLLLPEEDQHGQQDHTPEYADATA